jgi:hypothetical protein
MSELREQWETPGEFARRIGVPLKTVSRKFRHRLCPEDFHTHEGETGRIVRLRASRELETFMRTNPRSYALADGLTTSVRCLIIAFAFRAAFEVFIRLSTIDSVKERGSHGALRSQLSTDSQSPVSARPGEVGRADTLPQDRRMSSFSSGRSRRSQNYGGSLF